MKKGSNSQKEETSQKLNGEKKSKSLKKGGNKGGNQRSGRPKKEGIEKYESGIREFFTDYKREITVAGIVAVTGFAVYAIAKWAPINDIVDRIKEAYEDQFEDEDYDEEEEERL